MKRLLVLLFVLNLSVANAQIGIEGGVYGEYFRTDVSYTNANYIFSAGAVAYVQLGKYITLNYRFGVGNYSSEYRYIHCPTSWAIGGHLINRNGNIYGAFLGIIPEGIGFYTRKDHSGIHVGLNLLGFEYYHKRKDWHDDFEIRPDFLFRYRFRKESKFQLISPYAGVTLFYNSLKKVPDFKLGIAITFESKKSEPKESKGENESSIEKKKKRIFHTN